MEDPQRKFLQEIRAGKEGLNHQGKVSKGFLQEPRPRRLNKELLQEHHQGRIQEEFHQDPINKLFQQDKIS